MGLPVTICSHVCTKTSGIACLASGIACLGAELGGASHHRPLPLSPLVSALWWPSSDYQSVAGALVVGCVGFAIVTSLGPSAPAPLSESLTKHLAPNLLLVMTLTYQGSKLVKKNTVTYSIWILCLSKVLLQFATTREVLVIGYLLCRLHLWPYWSQCRALPIVNWWIMRNSNILACLLHFDCYREQFYSNTIGFCPCRFGGADIGVLKSMVESGNLGWWGCIVFVSQGIGNWALETCWPSIDEWSP